ncbi:hypothetical protein [Brevibacterium sp. 1718]|uniref:hypothetical protein n=1 Tax=Brevibacterium sp. 1718 TaxID=3413510 RepID=UPI003DA7CD6C
MSTEEITTRPDFPRPGRAPAQTGDEVEKVFERFSPAYEQQAADVWDALEKQDLKVWITGAGENDGETICAGRAIDDAALVIHLEDPNEALAVAAAREAGKLDDYIASGLA